MPNKKRKQKSLAGHTKEQNQISRSAKEMCQICDRLCATHNLQVPDLDWIINQLSEEGQVLARNWVRSASEQYGKVFAVIVNLLLTQTKEHKFLRGQEMEINAVSALTCEYALEKICDNFSDYEEELIAAALNPSPKYILEYGDHRSTNEYINFVKDAEAIWYPTYFSPTLQNYLFGLKEARGLPVTPQSFRKILGRLLIREQYTREKIANCIMLILIGTIEYLCLKFLDCQDQKTAPGYPIRALSAEMMPQINQDAIMQWKVKNGESYGTLMVDYINQDAPEFYKIYCEDCNIAKGGKEFLVLTYAAEIFGLPVSSFFHFTLLRIMDCLIYRDPSLLRGTHDYALRPKIDDRGVTIIDAHTKVELGTMASGEAEHILGRTQYLTSIITGAVQKSVAQRFAQLENQNKMIQIANQRFDEQREALESKKKEAERKLLAIQAESRKQQETIESLKAALKEKEAYIAGLEKDLEEQEAEPENTEQEGAAIQQIQYPVRLKKGFKALIYGGHASWATQIAERFPDIPIRRGQNSYTTEGIRNQDMILFQLNAISHSASGPALAEARKYGVETVNFQKAGWDTCSKQLYALLAERDAIAQ